MNLILFIIISFVNVFLHIFRSILVIKAGKFVASFMNMITYTFSAVVVKFISESSLWVAILVAATTNFIGCYLAMLVFEKIEKKYELQWYFAGIRICI